MTAITVRAPDSQKAMDEILQRLGPDALILSTRRSGRMVEITALPPDPGTAQAPRSRPAAPLLPEAEDDGGTAFAAALRAEAARLGRREPPPPPPPGAPARPAPLTPLRGAENLDDLARRLLPPAALIEEWPTRILIAGPPGAGKSMLAARLAARLMLAEPDCRPALIAPIPGAMLVEDRLRGWARLMGLVLERPALPAAMNLPEPDPAAPQIIDLSDVAAAAPELAARLIEAEDAELVLCLPAGLHPARVARACHDWQAFSPTVTLTGLDQWWPEQGELAAIADAGLRLTRTASGTGLVSALSRPGLADLRNWASGWSPAYAGAAE